MMNWYMNPELHDEDYAELADLLAEEEEEGGKAFLPKGKTFQKSLKKC